MATKKTTTSVSATLPEATEATVKEAAPKKPRKRTKRPTKQPNVETLPLHDVNIDPQVLAELAIKIIHLKSSSGMTQEGNPVRFDNAGLHDSLDDARRLLLAAKGVIDEDIDAYRLFSEKDGLMSFKKVAIRFKSFKWKFMTSRNTIEELICKLVNCAEEKVQKEREKYLTHLSIRYKYTGSVFHLVDRVEKQIRKIIDDCGPEMQFTDSDRMADLMAQFFLALMRSDLNEVWRGYEQEDCWTLLGFESFIEYVCGGMTYEQFIPPITGGMSIQKFKNSGTNVRMDYERWACVEFFLRNADNWTPSDYKLKAKDINIMRMVNSNQKNVPDSIDMHLNKCVTELRKTPANAESVKKTVRAAREEITIFCERLYLIKVVNVLLWDPKLDGLEYISELPGLPKAFPKSKIKHLHSLILETRESVEDPDFNPKSVHTNLDKVCENLEKFSILVKVRGARDFAKDMGNFVEYLKRGLQTNLFSPTDLERDLQEFLSDLKTNDMGKKCRPYELFLFAAQNNLFRDQLVRKRSSLVSGAVTGPPHPSSLSILESHRGAEIALPSEK